MEIRTVFAFVMSLVILTQFSRAAGASTEDPFQFFEEEAKVVTASRIAQPRVKAPATTYVVTSDDIKASGAQTIWDALRSVPGVDVAQTKTNQGEVSIRGLNQPMTNRTLVLLDGKTVLNSFFDVIVWESIPVTMQEIDRIEVVEGPASAVYGGNAVNGVINIITKTPDKMSGGQLSYTGGERNTQIGNFDYGRKQEAWAYKLGGGWRSMNQFSRSDQFASEAGKFSAFLGYTPAPETEWSFSGGVTDLNTQSTEGSAGDFFDKGISSFARTDYRYRKTKVRAYWNHDQTFLDQFPALNNPDLHCDSYNAEAEQSLSLPFRNEAVFGTSYRRNTARSTLLMPGLLAQDLWAIYAEDKWEMADHWSLTGSGRLDRHPFTPLLFSPRGSLLYTPVREHVFRISAGTSFRNPTLLENYVVTTVSVPNPGLGDTSLFPTIQNDSLGNRKLEPERMETVEIGHDGHFGSLETHVTGFHYKLKQIITQGSPQIVGMVPPTLNLQTSFVNSGDISAWGGEWGLVMHWNKRWSSYANYSYQYLHDNPEPQMLSLQSPRHKANTGLLFKQGGWTGNLWVNWVDRTFWPGDTSTPATMAPVSAYFLLNAHAGYAFSGRWKGLEVGVTAFNLLNHDHYEVLPPLNAIQQGQSGEIVRSRWTGTVSYKF